MAVLSSAVDNPHLIAMTTYHWMSVIELKDKVKDKGGREGLALRHWMISNQNRDQATSDRRVSDIWRGR